MTSSEELLMEELYDTYTHYEDEEERYKALWREEQELYARYLGEEAERALQEDIALQKEISWLQREHISSHVLETKEEWMKGVFLPEDEFDSIL